MQLALVFEKKFAHKIAQKHLISTCLAEYMLSYPFIVHSQLTFTSALAISLNFTSHYTSDHLSLDQPTALADVAPASPRPANDPPLDQPTAPADVAPASPEPKELPPTGLRLLRSEQPCSSDALAEMLY